MSQVFAPASYPMPFGKYAGMTLKQIDGLPGMAGRKYLQWAAQNLRGEAGDHVRAFLAGPSKPANKKRRRKKKRRRPESERLLSEQHDHLSSIQREPR